MHRQEYNPYKYIQRGQTFNQLTAIDFVERRNHVSFWNWQCDCGNKKVIRAPEVTTGGTKSCGCLALASVATHGATFGGKPTPEYSALSNIRQRCTNPANPGFRYYGKRGITICNALTDYVTFIRVVGLRPTKTHSIDRIDNSGNYSCGECPQCLENGWPMNLRWATKKMQAINTRHTRMYTLGDKTLCMADWARELGFSTSGMGKRINKWGAERALTIPKLGHMLQMREAL